MPDTSVIESGFKKPFNGDRYIAEEVEKLVKQFEISLIIETGTHLADTTIRLAEFAKVISIEIEPNFFNPSQERTKGNENIKLYHGNSVEVLKQILPEVGWTKILFYLDAHWGDYCPLIDELKVISRFNIKPVICIHDFKVPGRPDLGFDTYHGQDYTFEWIKPHIEAIYSKEYSYHYNQKAEGALRGIIYICPKFEL